MNQTTGPDIVLVAGGGFGAWAHPYLLPDRLLVGADRGALYLIENGYTPHMALGDFDSVTGEERRLIQERSFMFLDCDPIAKDLTDTQWALDWALAQRPASLLLMGVTGTRFDHTLANVHLLVRAAEAGIPCRIVDAHNEISLLPERGTLTLTKGAFEHVSLLPLSGTVTGITLDSFLYPLDNATLRLGETVGISNIITGETATVRSTAGLLLVIQSRD